MCPWAALHWLFSVASPPLSATLFHSLSISSRPISVYLCCSYLFPSNAHHCFCWLSCCCCCCCWKQVISRRISFHNLLPLSVSLSLSLHKSFLYFSFNSRSSSTASETFLSLILLMSSQLLSFCFPLAPLPLRHSQHQQRKRALLLIVLMRQFKVIILMSWQAWLSGWPALLGPERCSSSRFPGHSHCHWRFPFFSRLLKTVNCIATVASSHLTRQFYFCFDLDEHKGSHYMSPAAAAVAFDLLNCVRAAAESSRDAHFTAMSFSGLRLRRQQQRPLQMKQLWRCRDLRTYRAAATHYFDYRSLHWQTLKSRHCLQSPFLGYWKFFILIKDKVHSFLRNIKLYFTV